MRLIDADALIVTYPVPGWFIINVLDKAPTVDAVPVRHGKWLPYIVRLTRSVKGGMYEKGLRCSLCNYKDGDEEYAYCPRCGAKMDKEEP